MQRRTKNRIRPSPSTPLSSGIELFWQSFARLALSQLAFTQLAISQFCTPPSTTPSITSSQGSVRTLCTLPTFQGARPKIAAADEAAHDVLVFLYPAFQVSLDTELQQDLALLPDNERKAQGVAVGQEVAGQRLAGP